MMGGRPQAVAGAMPFLAYTEISPCGDPPGSLGFPAVSSRGSQQSLWSLGCSLSPVLSLPRLHAELHLEGNFLHRLPSEVSALQHLKAIDLSRNQFHDFPEQLTTLPALETINLEENEIVGEWSQPTIPCPSLSLRFYI